MPPINMTVADLADETGINLVPLYAWRKQVRLAGVVVLGDRKPAESWFSADKFHLVVKSAGLNVMELSEYCLRKGLYVEQIRAWRVACEQANALAETQARVIREQSI